MSFGHIECLRDLPKAAAIHSVLGRHLLWIYSAKMLRTILLTVSCTCYCSCLAQYQQKSEHNAAGNLAWRGQLRPCLWGLKSCAKYWLCPRGHRHGRGDGEEKRTVWDASIEPSCKHSGQIEPLACIKRDCKSEFACIYCSPEPLFQLRG